MSRVVSILAVGLFLVATASCGASAALVMQDLLDGSNLGVASQITYDTGYDNLAAKFSQPDDYIRYEAVQFPVQGSITFRIKPTGYRGPGGVADVILDTFGSNTNKQKGDMRVWMLQSYTLYFGVQNGSGIQYIHSTHPLNLNQWNTVMLSYGSNGMMLLVNGDPLVLGSCTDVRANDDVYIGDFHPDNPTLENAFIGLLDNLRTSDVQGGDELVPEPSSILTLFGGAVCSLGMLIRKRR